MMSSKWIAGLAGIVLTIVLTMGLGCDKRAGIKTETLDLEHKKSCPAAEAKEAALPAEKSAYQTQIKPLTTAECGQCHLSIFEAIRKQGGRHQIDCVRCHREYHVYNPRKQNYEEIMPDCAWCHVSATGGAFHGDNPNITPCLSCHADPHKPMAIPMAEVEDYCAMCHTKEGGEICNNPSKHTTDVTCADCHAEKHGFIPECSACHESHSPEVQMATADCMTCHPVHKPKMISYAEETENPVCAGCHGDVENMLQKKVTLHTEVKCADCHPSHKEIPPCTRCHGEPHPKDMMLDTSKCGTCHGIAHDLNM